MFLNKEFVELCKISLFKWSQEDLNDFKCYSLDVAKYYYENFEFIDVLRIFDSIDDNDNGYLTINMCNKDKYDKVFDVMYYFYEDIKKKYFETFIKKYEDDINANNPNEIIEKYVKVFKPLVLNNKYKKIVRRGDTFYRARLGNSEIIETVDGNSIKVVCPYSDDNIKNPPSSLAKEGRFNRDGFSYYYLSSTIDGAISEVRPKVGNYCSVAEFNVNEDLVLFEFGDLLDLFYYFMKPVCDEVKSHYKFTQFFSDVMCKCGVDGIQYYGVQTGFICLVCFYPKKIDYINKSEILCEIQGVKYNYYLKTK